MLDYVVQHNDYVLNRFHCVWEKIGWQRSLRTHAEFRPWDRT